MKVSDEDLTYGLRTFAPWTSDKQRARKHAKVCAAIEAELLALRAVADAAQAWHWDGTLLQWAAFEAALKAAGR